MTDKKMNNRSERSMNDSDIYTTATNQNDGERGMKDVYLSDDEDLSSIPTSTYTDELFSSMDDDDINNQKGSRKVAPPRRKRNSVCCICQRVVTPIILVLIVTVFLIYYFGDSSMLEGIIPGTDALFSSEDLGEQYTWRRTTGSNEGNGLTLRVVNALDTQWHTYFNVAVYDWDNGTPDALTLSSDVASAPDPDCTVIEGVIKMCNKDYGEQDWMGVNEVLKYDNEIAASIGIMNDYFFSTSVADDAKRQYTMCHEMGHGFGLPHTDTALWNRNQGNCLDYTNRPKQNMRPGQINYDRLVAVYGVVGTDTNSANNTTTPPTNSNEPDDNTDVKNENGNAVNNGTNEDADTPSNEDEDLNQGTNETNKNDTNTNEQQDLNDGNNNKDNNKDTEDEKRHRRGLSSSHPIPSWIHDRIREVREEYTHSNNRRTLLRSRNSGSSNDNYKIDLGSGYSMEIQFTRPF